jgi:hypothetical protein
MIYKEFLIQFINKGYSFCLFRNNIKKDDLHGKIFLRHDVDFDIDYAVNMAYIENEINIQSTYFFLLCSNSYNLLSQQNIEKINKIKQLGHNISLHFDPSIYKSKENITDGLKKELNLFNKTFNTNVDIISLHRPMKFINDDYSILNIHHTYMKQYNELLKYFSDSRNKFKYRNPLDSLEFKNLKPMQILIHPI